MVRIRLFCAAGFSTAMLVKKMNEAAALENMEVDIQAFSQGKLADHTKDADVALYTKDGKTYTYNVPNSISNELVKLGRLRLIVFVAKNPQEIYTGSDDVAIINIPSSIPSVVS